MAARNLKFVGTVVFSRPNLIILVASPLFPAEISPIIQNRLVLHTMQIVAFNFEVKILYQRLNSDFVWSHWFSWKSVLKLRKNCVEICTIILRVVVVGNKKKKKHVRFLAVKIIESIGSAAWLDGWAWPTHIVVLRDISRAKYEYDDYVDWYDNCDKDYAEDVGWAAQIRPSQTKPNQQQNRPTMKWQWKRYISPATLNRDTVHIRLCTEWRTNVIPLAIGLKQF